MIYNSQIFSVIIAFTIETFEEQHGLLEAGDEAEDNIGVDNDEIRERIQLALKRTPSANNQKGVRVKYKKHLAFLFEEQYRSELQNIVQQNSKDKDANVMT
jgi:hypothetical protein